ncbi:MAG: metal-dependent hydrolase [Chitinophagaceae bacterium]|nr:MAG: metal-dependent hydrolase [Chitinophagaceae bacterium]
MRYTYYGQSCFAVQIKGKSILFDPFITGNPLAKDIDVNKIKADYILVSHGHQDHILDLISIAGRTGAKVVSNFEIIGWLAKQGIRNGHPMNHGGKWTFDFGTVKYVNAIHSSSFADGSYAGNPGGFVINSEEGTFYFTGDTALTTDMQVIPRFFKLDFSVMCVGDAFTMGYEEALMAAEMVQCKKVIGVHYDTFDLIKLDKRASQEYFAKAGYQLLLPEIGETIDV